MSGAGGGGSGVSIEVVDDPAHACAAVLVGAVAGGQDVVLAGGGTPRAAYEELVRVVLSASVDVSGARLWVGDERCVPPDDERSNFKMIRESLLDPLRERGLPEVFRMKGELGFDEGAADYERLLLSVRGASGERPRFGIVLLGIGPDGHTASLFPDQPSLSERTRLVVGVPEAGLEPFVPRITMTFSALGDCEEIVVLAAGASKADAVEAAFGPDARPDPHVPSSLLPTLGTRVRVLIDAAAASKL